MLPIKAFSSKWQTRLMRFCLVQVKAVYITEPSEIIALHRICGWALKSVIDEHRKHLKAKPSSDMANELNLLEAMKLPSEVKQSLPLALQCLDRRGLTFIQSPFVPWMQ